MNTMRHSWIAALLALAGAAESAWAQPGAAERMSGVWQIMTPKAELRTAAGQTPPLLPEAQSQYEQRRASLARGDRTVDPMNRCLPPGVPRLLSTDMPFELLPQRGRVVFMYQWNRLARIADLDRPLGDSLAPTWLGQSVAHWDGDALVVESNGFNDQTFLDDHGLPHSDALRVRERYTLDASGRRLTAELHIDDAKTYSAPWDARLTFRRRPGVRITEDVCVERLGLEAYK